MGVLGSHNCHLVRIFWQNGRINLVGRVYQQTGNREQGGTTSKPYCLAGQESMEESPSNC
jgi:hypothetical protein